ncbi:MAG: hypothetical protein HY686_00015 [Chloroflexi bacterium]|nr:hypothetical protein [Chloroflexota bacterium]
MASSASPRQDELIACIRSLRETLERLQELLELPQEDTMERFYKRRKELLASIYLAGGMDKDRLFAFLDQHNTPHQWIGQQVKAGYLEKLPRPGGADLYAVTHKAVGQLGLEGETEGLAAISEEALAADWDNPEDAAYDKL